MAGTRITVPANVARGSLVEIRTLVAHPMETGYRLGDDGQLLPRNLIRRFECRLDGELVIIADLHAAVAANPYLAFSIRAQASGTLSFRWEGDQGFVQTETAALVVT